MKYLEMFDKDGKALHIADVMHNAYFDIPDREMSYATYSTKAYFDEQGWYLVDCDGKKQYEDEKWLDSKKTLFKQRCTTVKCVYNLSKVCKNRNITDTCKLYKK